MIDWIQRMFTVRLVYDAWTKTWGWHDWAGWGPGVSKTKVGAWFLAARGKE